MKRNLHITLFIILLIILAFLPFNLIFSKAEETEIVADSNETESEETTTSGEDDVTPISDGSYSLSANIWNTSQYDEGGIDLTEDGIEITGWEYETSKYLQINPIVPADGNTYFVSIILPEEFYIVGSELITPAGYQGVEFTKNEDIIINDSTSIELNTYSGTAVYTLNNMGVSGTIQLELSYDVRLWDKQAGSSITSSDVMPVTVVLSQKDSSNTVTELKRVCVNKVTAGNSNKDSFGLSLKIEGESSSSSQVTTLQDKYVTVTQSINNNNGTARYKLYEKLTTTISLPYYTYTDGTKYYIPVDASSISFGSNLKYTSYEIDTSKIESEGKFDITFENPYWYTSTMISFNVGPLQQELIDMENVTEFKFANGKITHVVDSRNGTTGIQYCNLSLGTIIYQKDVSENVTLSRTSKSVTIVERPENAVSLLGGFYLANSGTGDSCAKNININFDVDNTNLVRVTTINIMADNVQEYMEVKYTLVDENGDRVYLDESGNRVDENTDGAIGEWTYSLKNSYYGSTSKSNLRNTLVRSKLPENQTGYYFKSVSYRLEKIESQALLSAPSASSNLKGAGNFLGYVDDVNGTHGQTAKHTIEVISDNTAISTLTTNVTTTLQTTSGPTYVVNDTYLKMSETTIQAGGSLTATGRITAVEYPYGNCTWVKGITIGVLLPTGVSVNEQAIVIKNASGATIADYTISTQDVGNGNVLWKIRLPDDVYIGVATESIGSLNGGLYINFSIQLDTSYAMNGTTLFAKDIFYVAGYKQTNSASGSYGWSSAVDTYDLNENGSTTDKIGCTKSTVTTSCQVVAQTATLDVTDSISVERQGSITSESSKGALLSEGDIINYNLDISCLSGGQTEDFLYFIPIVKKSSAVDSFLIENSENGIFDLSLKEVVSISGSDIFTIEYSFEEGLTYTTAQEVTDWYTAEEIEANSLDIKDATMIRLTVTNNAIKNGDETRITAKLIYNGDNYLAESGLENIWHSGGFYKYINSDRESAGNFSTEGATVSIADTIEVNDITLTAAKNMSPQIEGNVTTDSLDNSILTNFVNSHTFSITSVETYNVTLQTKSYILANTDMAGIDANQTFAITVKMPNGAETDILTSASSTPVEIGTSSAGAIPEFSFNIYNADAIADNSQARYIIVTLTSDNGLTIIQKVNINREIAEASDPKSAIVAGKRYITFDDTSKEVTISEDSAFTAQFIVEYIPSLYSNQEIEFSTTLPNGTNLILENLTDFSNPTYWYYKVGDTGVSSLKLTEFKAMGTTNSDNYILSDSIDMIEEKLLLIVDFSNCTTYLTEDSYEVKMNVAGTTDTEDFSTDYLNFSTVSKSTYTLNDIENVYFEEDFDIGYSINLTSGAASKYEGRKISLVLTASSNIPTDTHVVTNNTTYYLNEEKQFIVPLGDIENISSSVSLKLVSNMLPTNDITYDFSASLWISATANSAAPMLGEIIGTKTFTVSSEGSLNPSLKVESMSTRVIHRADLANTFSLVYEYIEAEDCSVTVELQQKIGTAYQKVTDRLNQVNNTTVHNIGVYSLDAVNGENEMKFKLSSAITNYTYRLVIRVNDSDGVQLLEVPYTFVVMD